MVKVYASMGAGYVEYNKGEAEVDINDLIAALEEVRDEGATHVIGLSGNYRGAQYVRLGMPIIDDDEEW